MKSIKVKVTGKVQGVWYRANTQKKAIELNISGTVENCPDGSVLIYAKGNESSLDKFISWCKKGPDLADVENIEKENIDNLDVESFEIIR